MTQDIRRVSVERIGPGRFRATNERGQTLDMSSTGGQHFTPVELLLSAIAGCTGMDVDVLTSRRAEPETFHLDVQAEKVRDQDGNRLTDVQVVFSVSFPDGEAGDAARELLPLAVRKSHERLCIVSRTVQLPTEVTTRIESSG